jgi:hypothetical protein
VTAAGPKSWTLDVRDGADPAGVLPSLWARAMIRTLEEEDGVQQSASISAGGSERSRLIDISKRYNVVCGLTSFVAVEHRSLEDRNDGRPALRRVPSMLAAGWGAIEVEAASGAAGASLCLDGLDAGSGLLDLTRESDDTAYGAELLDEISPAPAAKRRAAPAAPPLPPVSAAAPAQAPVASKPRGGVFDKLKKAFGGAAGGVSTFKNGLKDSGGGGRDRAMEAAVYRARSEAALNSPPVEGMPGRGNAGDDLIDLLNHQSADGAFATAAPIERHLAEDGHDPAKVHKAIDDALAQAGCAPAAATRVRRTVLLMVTLRLAFAARAAVWKRAYDKAAAWVARESGVAKDAVTGAIAAVEARFARPT